MRDLDTVDFELRLLAAVRRSIREHGGAPSSRHAAGRMQETDGKLKAALVCTALMPFSATTIDQARLPTPRREDAGPFKAGARRPRGVPPHFTPAGRGGWTLGARESGTQCV
jgi:hypothetical protein